MFLSPGEPSAHQDDFVRRMLPARELWPRLDYSGLPELAALPGRLNAAHYLLDQRLAEGLGQRPVLHVADATWSYAVLADRVARLAAVLVRDFGLEPGQRVLLRGANTPMMVACWFAVLKAGGVVVATMPLLRAKELSYMLGRAGVRLALCELALADELALAAAVAPEPVTLSHFTALGDALGAEADLDRRMAAAPAGFPTVDTAADDPALIAFTSGTTGHPKGTIHSHRDLAAVTECFPRHTAPVAPDDVFTGSPPLAFTFGLGALTLFPMRYGASTALVDKPTPENLLDAIRRHRVTTLYTAPTAYRTLAGLIGPAELATLKACVSAGEHLPRATWEQWHRATGIEIVDGIGATEMLHIFISAPVGRIQPGSTGRAVPGYQARVVDDDGRTAAPGTPGRLAVIGPTGCRYLDDPERQKTYVQWGWNLTGDVYRMEEDGSFWYVARGDDMIISAGYNISGPEVEGVLLDHPLVRECAVVSAPDDDRGAIVKAFVVLADPAAEGPETTRALQDFVKARIAPYKYPRAIEYRAELPKTATGKLQRFRLRDGG